MAVPTQTLRRRGRALALHSVALVMGLTASTGVAGAAPAAPDTGTTAVATATSAGRTFYVTKRIEFRDRACHKKRAASGVKGKCQGVAKLRSTRPYRYASAMRSARGNVTWCQDWQMEMRGLYYVNWKEEARGSFCWVEGPAAPAIPRNDWKCGYGFAVGYDIRQVDCWDQRRTGDTTYGWWISVYDQFRVTAVVKGFPIAATHQFHVNLHPTGTLTGYVD